jgi:hypothetical protein
MHFTFCTFVTDARVVELGRRKSHNKPVCAPRNESVSHRRKRILCSVAEGNQPMRLAPLPISVEEAMRASEIVIEVPANQTFTVGIHSEQYPDAYCIANVRSFDDLHTLGLVPRGISEEASRSAIAEDDREFQVRARDFQLRQSTTRTTSDCPCRGDHSQSMPISRRKTQPNLAALLPERFRGTGGEPSPGVLHIYQHLRRWFDKPSLYLVGLVRSQAIVIQANSVLVMDSSVSLVQASFINISSGGRLKLLAGMVNVRCDSLNGPASEEDPPPYHPPTHDNPWPPARWPPLRSGEEIAARYLPGYSNVQKAK